MKHVLLILFYLPLINGEKKYQYLNQLLIHQIYKIDYKNDGEISFYEGNRGKWKKIDSKGIVAKVNKDAQQQSTLELSIPFSVLNKIDRKPMRINLMLETSAYKESLINSTPEATCSWMKVVF